MIMLLMMVMMMTMTAVSQDVVEREVQVFTNFTGQVPHLTLHLFIILSFPIFLI